MGTRRIVVVGGGIVGASVAHHLAERTDDPVVVYERGELAAETTFRATAMIGATGPDPYRRMKEYGFRLYNEFFAEPRSQVGYRQAGRLRVATSPRSARRLEDVAASRAEAPAEPPSERDAGAIDPDPFSNTLVSYVPGDELRSRFLLPHLETDLVEGALYRPQYGYIRDESRTLGPRELALEFVERARGNGARFETHTDVTDVLVDGNAAVGVETNGSETVDVGSVVCAAGPWNASVAALAGLDLPVGHRLSPVYSLTLDDPLPYTMPAIKSHDSSVGLHPKREDVVLVTYAPDEAERLSRYDPAEIGDTAPAEFRERALRSAERLLPVLADADLTDEWVGLGTRTPDGKPIAGWTAVDGLAVAATMSGIQYAPAIGSIVARQLVDRDPTEYYDAVSISRFDGREDSHSP